MENEIIIRFLKSTNKSTNYINESINNENEDEPDLKGEESYYKDELDESSNKNINNFSEISPSKQDNIISISISEENKKIEKEKEKAKKVIFISKKRGRKSIRDKNKKNRRYDFDNIYKTIIKNYFLFLIQLANAAIDSDTNLTQYKFSFEKIPHDTKNSINLTKFKKYLQKKYKEIFYIIPIEKKIVDNKKRRKDPNAIIKNKEIYESICNLSPNLKEFFEQKLSDILKNYYCKNKNLIENNFDFNGLKIKISQKIGTFHDLLAKREKKELKERYILTMDKYFNCKV